MEGRGYFLLLYDVIASSVFMRKHGPQKLHSALDGFHRKVNRKFSHCIVFHEIGSGKTLSRFERILGDGGGAYFSTADVIGSILQFADQLPFRLRWTVARDGWDEKNISILK